MKGNILAKVLLVFLCVFSFTASAASERFTIVAVKGDDARAATYILKEGKTREDIKELLSKIDQYIRNDSGLVARRVGR